MQKTDCHELAELVINIFCRTQMNGGGLCAQESRDSRNLWFQKLPVLYTMKTSEGGFMKLLNTCRCWSENRQNNAAPRSTQHSIFRFSFLILNVKPPALTFWERKIWFHRKNGFQVIFLRGWGLDFIFSRKCLECVSHGFLCFWSCLQHFFCLLTSFMWISRFFWNPIKNASSADPLKL